MLFPHSMPNNSILALSPDADKECNQKQKEDAKMKKVTISCWCVLFCLALPVFAIDLAPGGVLLSGTLTDAGDYCIQLQIQQLPPDQARILGVKVYTEPSHTLMLALVDESAPPSLLLAVQEEQPSAMATGIIGQSYPRVEVPAPPISDQRIRVEYAVKSDEGIASLPVADALLPSLDSVAFYSEPIGGDSTNGHFYRLCGWCYFGGPVELCGCIKCPTPEFTLCCGLQPCEVFCGHVLCSD